jgi:NAD-dependent SIR2 family protein deacetylase
MDALDAPLHHCNTCGRQTRDVYRVKRIYKGLLRKIHQCAECYENEVRRAARESGGQDHKPLSE